MEYGRRFNLYPNYSITVVKKTMKFLQTVVGDEGGPVPGQTTYRNTKLENAIVQFLIVNNIPENGLEPEPDFFNNPIKGEIKRNNPWVNPWVLADKLIIVYEKCNCK
jgi:hypothetical protein